MHDRWTMLLHKQGARAPHGPEHGSRQPENEEQKTRRTDGWVHEKRYPSGGVLELFVLQSHGIL